MTASPIARLVVIILGALALIPVAASAVGSVIRGEPVTADVLDIAIGALGFVGGVLSKTTIGGDSQTVTVTDDAVQVTDSAQPPDPAGA